MLLTKILICAINLKKILVDYFSYSPLPASPLPLGLTENSRKGRVFPSLFPGDGPPLFFKTKQCVVKWPRPGPLPGNQDYPVGKVPGTNF